MLCNWDDDTMHKRHLWIFIKKAQKTSMEQPEQHLQPQRIHMISLLVLWGAGSGQILAHWQQEECKCNCCKNWGEEQSTGQWDLKPNTPRLLVPLVSVCSMRQLMVFSFNNQLGKRGLPQSVWLQNRNPYSNYAVVVLLCHDERGGSYLQCRWWRPPVPSQRRRTWLAETRRLLWAETGPAWSL